MSSLLWTGLGYAGSAAKLATGYVSSLISKKESEEEFCENELHDGIVTAAQIAFLTQEGENIKFHIGNHRDNHRDSNRVVYDYSYVKTPLGDPIQAYYREGATKDEVYSKGIYYRSVNDLIEMYPVGTKASGFIAALLKIQALGILWHNRTYNEGLLHEYTEKFLEKIEVYTSEVYLFFHKDSQPEEVKQFSFKHLKTRPEYKEVEKTIAVAIKYWTAVKDCYTQIQEENLDFVSELSEVDRLVRQSWRADILQIFVSNIFLYFENLQTTPREKLTKDRVAIEDMIDKRVKSFIKIKNTVKQSHLQKSREERKVTLESLTPMEQEVIFPIDEGEDDESL